MAKYFAVDSKTRELTGQLAYGNGIEGYLDAYMERGMLDVDPVTWRGQREVLPIPWGLPEHRIELSAAEKGLYGLLADYGVQCGLTVPIHDSTHYSMFVLFADEGRESFRKRLPLLAGTTQLMAAYVHDATIRVIGENYTADTPSLTLREQECLVWAAAGKTAWETSLILSVAQATVVFHTENAKKKLNAKTLPQAVARAVMFGLIRP